MAEEKKALATRESKKTGPQEFEELSQRIRKKNKRRREGNSTVELLFIQVLFCSLVSVCLL